MIEYTIYSGYTMRNENEMMDLILSVAKNDKRIRAVIMNGSRTNPNVPKDIFQDYDVVYIVNSIDIFIENDNWIDVFGKRIILQLPEDKTKVLLPPANNGAFNYLMLFEDGNRIDLTLIPLEKQKEILENDSLTIVLLDKDNILPLFEKSNDSDYYEVIPTEEIFYECCNEFWWVIQNVAKGIWRDELPYANRMFIYVRDMLDKMISWYIGIQHDFKISTGKHGKYFKKLLEKDLWNMYYETYSDGNYEHFWKSIFMSCKLFRIAGLKVAESLQFKYNNEEDSNMTNYLKQVRKLPKDTKEIIP
jgi:aminoglycoside 6-adenylyltransferase